MCKRSLSIIIISLMLLTLTGCNNDVTVSVPKVAQETHVLTEDTTSDVVNKTDDVYVSQNISIEREALESLSINASNMVDILESIDEINNKFSKIIELNETTYTVVSEELDSFVKSSNTTYTMHELDGESIIVVKTNIDGNVAEAISVEIIYDNKEQAWELMGEILGKLEPTGTVKFKTNTNVYETDNNENLTFAGLDNIKLGRDTLSMNISLKSHIAYDMLTVDDMWGLLEDFDYNLGKNKEDIKISLIQLFEGFESEQDELADEINETAEIDESIAETDESIAEEQEKDYSNYDLNISTIKLENGEVKSVRCNIEYCNSSITAEIKEGKTVVEYNCLRREIDSISLLDNITNCIDGISVNIYQNDNVFTAETDEHKYTATMENYGNNTEIHQIKYSVNIEKK